MDERLFARLSELLQRNTPVVLASVLATRGATPRKRGSRMLVTATHDEFSVGGGMAESRVLEAARRLLADGGERDEVAIDLSGRPGAAGVCGGSMRIALRRWAGERDRARAATIADTLRAGQPAPLDDDDLGADAAHAGADESTTREAGGSAAREARPDPRLLIVGAGHCGLALYDLARFLDYEQWVFDPRPACFRDGRFAHATRLCGEPALLADALATARDVHAVLLNRDFRADVAALEVLCTRPPAFLGMMGSPKRIAEVRAALPDYAHAFESLHAPVGLDLPAETPHEIAVTILAQLLEARNPRTTDPGSSVGR